MAALGVPSDCIEYIMSYKLSTCHDVRMKGIEFLPSIYAAANLKIFQKQKITLADILKEIIRSRGKILQNTLKSRLWLEGSSFPRRRDGDLC